ncbi:MAG: BLUF domain-containing protein [Cyclobacteriaceae bacterium]
MDTKKSLHSLVYVSHTSYPWTDLELNNLVTKAASHNSEKEITGMLVHSNNRFLQVLEGEERHVKSLYKTICADKRHEKVLLLVEHPISRRNFVGWSMGYKSIESEQLERASGFTSIDQFFEKPNVENSGHPALTFLKKFYEKNY